MSPIETKEQNRFYSLQALRGIAALMVFLHHVKGYSNIVDSNATTIYNVIPQIFGYGAPLFFCISGFLMAYLININYKKFLLRRLLRIYPPFILAVIVIIFIKCITLNAVSFNKLFLSLTLLPVGAGTSYPLSIEWTLVYEVFFYFVCAIFSIKILKKLFLPFLFLWSTIILVGHYYFSVPTDILPVIRTIPFSTLNFCFIAGALVFYITKLKIRIPKSINYVLIGVVTAAALLIYYNLLGNAAMYDAKYIIYGVLFGILLYLVVMLDIKPSNPLVKCGDYSYGIYLIHAQILLVLYTIWKDKLGFPINSLAGTFVLITTFIISWYFGKLEFNLHNRLKKLKFKFTSIKINKLKIAVAGAVLLILVLQTVLVNYPVTKASGPDTKLVTAEQFDRTRNIITGTSPGWVDKVSSNNVKNNQDITIIGWAVDPVNKKPVKSIVLVSDNLVIPIQVSWYERAGIAQLFKTEDVLNSGFKITLNSGNLKSQDNSIKLYAVTDKEEYYPISTVKPIVITKK